MAINSDYVQQMAQQLATYDVQSQQTSIARRETQYNSQVKALSSLKSALSTFSSAVNGLKTTVGSNKSLIVNSAKFSEEGYATATVGSNAMAGSYTFTVEALAKKSQVALSGLDESQLGAGTLQISQPAAKDGEAARAFSVNLDGLSTLAEVAEAINKSADNESVQATLVRSGSSVNLVLTSKDTGANEAISFKFSDTALNTSVTPKVLSVAQDAKVRLGSVDKDASGNDVDNSIVLTNATNTFDNVFDGVSLTLSKAHKEGESLTLDIGQDQAATKGKVETFVNAYNTLMSTVKSLSASGGDGAARGALAGDSSLTAIKSMINNTLRTSFDGANLINFGVKATSTGTLSLDATIFDKALAADSKGLDTLFTGKGNLLDSMTDALKVYTASAGGVLTERVATLNERLSGISKEYDKLQTKYDNSYARYLKQYTNMMQIMNSMEQTTNMFTTSEKS